MDEDIFDSPIDWVNRHIRRFVHTDGQACPRGVWCEPRAGVGMTQRGRIIVVGGYGAVGREAAATPRDGRSQRRAGARGDQPPRSALCRCRGIDVAEIDGAESTDVEIGVLLGSGERHGAAAIDWTLDALAELGPSWHMAFPPPRRASNDTVAQAPN